MKWLEWNFTKKGAFSFYDYISFLVRTKKRFLKVQMLTWVTNNTTWLQISVASNSKFSTLRFISA